MALPGGYISRSAGPTLVSNLRRAAASFGCAGPSDVILVLQTGGERSQDQHRPGEGVKRDACAGHLTVTISMAEEPATFSTRTVAERIEYEHWWRSAFSQKLRTNL